MRSIFVVSIVGHGVKSSKVLLEGLTLTHLIQQVGKLFRNQVAVDGVKKVEGHTLEVCFPSCGEQSITAEGSE